MKAIKVQINGVGLRRGPKKMYVTDPEKIKAYKKMQDYNMQTLGDIKLKEVSL